MSIKVSVCVNADAPAHVHELGTCPERSTHVLHVHLDPHGPLGARPAAPAKPFWGEMHAGNFSNVLLVLPGKRNLTLGGISMQLIISRAGGGPGFA